jgi:amidase
MSLTASSSELLGRSATEQAGLVRSGDVSARELVEASLDSIERLNPELNSFVALCPERALAEAARIRAGDPRPLCGVPLGLKDLLGATEGLPTTHGSAAFGDWVAAHDTAHVRRLREAGAIVIGKTNTPELGLRPVTENARFGATRNPWDPALSPGGSSGGSAAAVAAGLVPLADGSDFGGSIRIPAACCGVVGIRPSTGRVSIGPDYHDVSSGIGVDGALARTVLDVAVALDVMSGYEPGDRHWLPAPAQPFAESAQRPPGRLPVRVALDAPNGVPVDVEPRAAAARAAAALSDLGHDVREEAPDWDDEGFGAAWMTAGTTTMQHLLHVLARLHGQPFDPDALEPATRGWLVDGPQPTAVEYLETGERLGAYARRVLTGWPSDGVLVTPTLTRLPIEIGQPAQAGVTDDAVRFSAFVRVWNVTGQPALSLPLGESAGGLPVGVQIVGPPGRDDLVLAVAAQLESAAGLRPRGPAQISALTGDAR